jgi:cellulose biosynthesis protein BcsQ
MNIDVLLLGRDAGYIKRLADIMKRSQPKNGDTLNVAMFTDVEKLRFSLSDQKKGRRAKYHIALIDEDEDVGDIDLSDILVVTLTAESDRNGNSYQFGKETDSLNLYKYQRVSGIVDAFIIEYAKKRDLKKKGSAPVYAFFSAQGGGGTSTVAAAYAVALAKAGIKPLYVSFEFFNLTELFFNDPTGTDKGLYDVFSSIAAGGNALAIIDAIRNNDGRGVAFLKKFTLWNEVAQIAPQEMQAFIDAAQAANGIGAVIIDLGSVYAEFTETVLDNADEIFLVANAQGTWLDKLGSLLNKGASFAKNHEDRVNFIFNRSQGQERYPDFDAKKIVHVRNFTAARPNELINAVAGEFAGAVMAHAGR